ncbi:MAG: FAD-dependent oxidoreductase [Erysipelotrichaceae bacterium]|nr:FAD-dependent oxidoreductase [Erysipelotrichaceae bacterium]
MKFKELFSPIRINSLMLPNRIIAAPFTDDTETPEKMKSGAAINYIGSMGIDHKSARWFDMPYPFAKPQRYETKDKLDYYKSGGSYVGAELMHPGLWNRNDETWGPNDEINPEGVHVKQLQKKDMDEIAESWGRSALEAKNFGFDIVVLHFAHGWLIPQFLSPAINHRTDEYGGSYENRARFPLACVKKVREYVGPDYPIDMRLSANEWIENGIEFEDVVRFVKDCEPYIDMVNISAGLDMDKGANVHMAQSAFEPHCTNKEYARKVKESVTKIAVSVVGSVMTPAEANELIKEGYCDLVYLGRPLLADAYWIKKAKEGNDEDIRPCIRCTYCMHWSTDRRSRSCSVNVRPWRYNYIPEHPVKAEIKKKVMIIGGGVAGMNAALVAKDRGHEVFLYEKEDRLGGLLKYSDYDDAKQDIRNYRNYLIRQVEKSDIRVFLNTPVTNETVKALNPDEVIVAIGSEQSCPPIKGVENAVGALDVYPKLDEVGENVIIIGGGTIGCELGIELARRGRKVRILEAGDKLHRQDSIYYDIVLDQQLALCKTLTTETNVKVTQINKKSVSYVAADGKEINEKADCVIIATGLKARREEAFSFFTGEYSVHMIGDCTNPGKIKDANEDAYFLAANI